LGSEYKSEFRCPEMGTRRFLFEDGEETFDEFAVSACERK
jgi:hypothetical protein